MKGNISMIITPKERYRVHSEYTRQLSDYKITYDGNDISDDSQECKKEYER